MRTAKNVIWTSLLAIAMLAIILYNGNSDWLKLALLLANFFFAFMWYRVSSWGQAVRKFINALLNANN